jgi:toxin ParE1/3/4
MKLRFTPRATANLAEIADYIRADNPAAAGRVRDAILRSLQLLTSFPRLGRAQSAPNVRKLVTRRYGYLVYYMINENAAEIIVLSIQHPARRPNDPDA